MLAKRVDNIVKENPYSLWRLCENRTSIMDNALLNMKIEIIWKNPLTKGLRRDNITRL